MKLSRPNRDELFSPLQEYFDSFFDGFFNKPQAFALTAGYPKVDIYTHEGHFVVQSFIPANKDDIHVTLVPGERPYAPMLLEISGRISEEFRGPDAAEWQIRELKRSTFSRTFQLPDWIQKDPEASFEKGVLTLKWKVPEHEAAKQPRQVRLG